MLRKQPWLNEASGAWRPAQEHCAKWPAVYLSVMGVKTEVKYPADENIWIDNAGVNQIVSIPDDESIL